LSKYYIVVYETDAGRFCNEYSDTQDFVTRNAYQLENGVGIHAAYEVGDDAVKRLDAMFDVKTAGI
jgi:hypothetical protein